MNEKQWEKPQVTVISTVEASETVLFTQSGSQTGSRNSINDSNELPPSK